MSFSISVKETDLMIHSRTDLRREATRIVDTYRHFIEAHILSDPAFATALSPLRLHSPAHEIIRKMCDESKKAGVGPMASVAGAIAEFTGKDLKAFSDEVIVENGGDIYIDVKGNLTIGIYAGNSPLSMKLGLKFTSIREPFSVCTSSGTVGHSLSMGTADAVCVVSESSLLADAAATSIGNHVKSDQDINAGIDFGKTIDGVKGIVIITGDKIGMWGEINIVKLKNT